MSQSARFPYVPVVSKRGETVAMPLLPIELRLAEGQPIRVQALLDSGSTVNVLPFTLGQRLGFVWENQKTAVTLTGILGSFEARAVLLTSCVAEFSPVRLVFAWTRNDAVPVLLGQVNFFQEFEVSFYGARRQFELQPARR